MVNKNLRDAFTLLRIPFSVFLMPVFWYAVSRSGGGQVTATAMVFIILHLLVYPASNGYNSMQDKDTSSIGGLRNPPPVNKYLPLLVYFLDFISIVAALFISIKFTILVAIYIAVSKAYSYRHIRLKKYAVTGAVIVSLFQGAFIFLAVAVAIGKYNESLLLPAFVSSLFLLGSYPLTQVYQHEQDKQSGDHTLSRLLGIRGTFIFSAIVLLIASALLVYDYRSIGQMKSIGIYLVCMLPVIVVFNSWLVKVFKNPAKADYDNTMRMNKISSLSLSTAFILILLLQI
jgi:4-hydroxybenzoate polyprenyltransferase